MHLRVGTYNIHSAIGLDRRYDPQRIAEVIKEMQADIIGLQEVSHRPDLLGIADQFQYFEEATGYFSVKGPNLILRDRRYGNALLSRWPVTEARLIDLAVANYEPRGAIDADILVDGQPIRVIVTHLGLRSSERRHQYKVLVDALGVDCGTIPTIIMGDFNSWLPDYRNLYRLGSRGRRFTVATFPAPFPLFTLDRILCWPSVMLKRVYPHVSRLSRAASDHLPLVADLVIESDKLKT